MIYKTPYETTLGEMVDLKNTIRTLKESVVRESLYSNNFDLAPMNDVLPCFVTGYGGSESVIPYFTHPLYVEMEGGMKLLCGDVRPFVRQRLEDRPTIRDVKNITDFNLAMSRMALSMEWMCSGTSRIKNDLFFAGQVYAYWISDSIGKRYGLDPKDQMIVTITAHYYYQSLFFDEIDEHRVQQFAVQTAKVTRMAPKMIFEVFDKIGEVKGVSSLCDAIKATTENIRMGELTTGVLLSMVANSWYGHNAKDIISVAIEHPPTWCSVVYASITERSYKNFLISKISERHGKNGLADGYVKAFADLVTEHKKKASTEEALVILPFED